MILEPKLGRALVDQLMHLCGMLSRVFIYIGQEFSRISFPGRKSPSNTKIDTAFIFQ
jgi:hypothetical protein